MAPAVVPSATKAKLVAASVSVRLQAALSATSDAEFAMLSQRRRGLTVVGCGAGPLFEPITIETPSRMNAFAKIDSPIPLTAPRRSDADASLRRLAVAFCAGLWVISTLFFVGGDIVLGGTSARRLQYFLVCGLVGTALSLAVFATVVWTRRLPRGPRYALSALAGLTGLVLHAASDTVYFLNAFPKQVAMAPPTPFGKVGQLMLINSMLLFPSYVLLLAGLALGLSVLAIRDRERRLAAAQAAAQEAQLAALRFQINPHFLFNALNAVSALVSAGRNQQADQVVSRLSDFFRSSLASAPGDLTTLEDELDIAGAYLDIEAARFGQRLQLDLDFDEDVRQALMPPLLLQPLLENAVKYGVAPTRRPVTLAVRAWSDGPDLMIEVSDDGCADRNAVRPAGAGVGLSNVSARLDALFPGRGVLTTERLDPGFRARIRLPLALDPASMKEK